MDSLFIGDWELSEWGQRRLTKGEIDMKPLLSSRLITGMSTIPFGELLGEP